MEVGGVLGLRPGRVGALQLGLLVVQHTAGLEPGGDVLLRSLAQVAQAQAAVICVRGAGRLRYAQHFRAVCGGVGCRVLILPDVKLRSVRKDGGRGLEEASQVHSLGLL